ncbi:MAG: hypothetical protein Q9165_004698 [Trypethelium subeluteriae]
MESSDPKDRKRQQSESAQRRLKRIEIGYDKIEKIWNSLLTETRLNLLAGDAVMRVLLREMFDNKQPERLHLHPLLQTWDDEYCTGKNIVKQMTSDMHADRFDDAVLTQSSVANEKMLVAENKMKLMLTAVERMEYENRAERAWNNDAKRDSSRQKIRQIRYANMLRIWSDLFTHLKFHGFKNFSNLEDIIDEIIAKSDGWKKSGRKGRFNPWYYFDPFHPADISYMGHFAKGPTPNFGGPQGNSRRFNDRGKKRSAKSSSSSSHASASKDESRQSNTEPCEPHHRRRRRTTRPPRATAEEDADDLRGPFSASLDSKIGKTNKLTPAPEKKIILDLKEYNRKWDALDRNSPRVPFPAPSFLASNISSSKLLAPGQERLRWTADERIMANIQAFYLLELGIRPRYWMERSQIKMGFSSTTPAEKVETLKLQLKKERFRWHPDKLGARKISAQEEDGSLSRDYALAKMVQLSAQNLYDACCIRAK